MQENKLKKLKHGQDYRSFKTVANSLGPFSYYLFQITRPCHKRLVFYCVVSRMISHRSSGSKVSFFVPHVCDNGK